MNPQRTKGQHYVPRAAYLEHFADHSDGGSLLWVYPVDESGVSLDGLRKIPPLQLCKETYMYEAPRLPVNAIEQLLERIETQYRECLSQKIQKRMSMTAEEKSRVSLFISTLEARVPAARDNVLRFLDDIKQKVTALEAHHNEGKKTSAHEEVDHARSYIFAQSLLTAAQLNRWQLSDYLFLEVPEDLATAEHGGFLLASDCPVAMYDFTLMNGFYGIPPLSRSNEVVIPLTSRLVLLINNCGLNGYSELDVNFIDETNNRTLSQCLESGRVISPHALSPEITNRIIKRNRQSFILRYSDERKNNTSEDSSGPTGAPDEPPLEPPQPGQ